MDDLRTRLAAALADRYTLEGLAGQGGMATVYRARDLKHQRPVAIKVLRPELAASIGSERFLREIELSAQLQHPHIVPLYDSGDAGGILYYIMPFVEGESLRDRLTREGKLPFEEAVRLTREVASGLAYAHARGVVHRDIKPENIMLSGGNAVVADFGIARALSAAQQEQSMTGLGMAIGTPAYMSPEQATASEVDGRSDQYSLAVVFYEMVTGATPFAATTPQAVLTKALTAVRPRLSKITRTTPVEADTPLVRALDTDPARRFASVTEFADALERSAGGGAGAVAERQRLKRLVIGLPVAVAILALGWILFGPTRSGPVVAGAESIAVLPFSTSGPGVELMGEGMVDLLSTNLNAVGGIRAADPRQVLARWKKSGGTGGADVEAALAVARGVKASAALVGSIVATGSAVRMSADLYGQDGKSLGHAQVDGAADSVLALVDELSLSLVREIWRSKEPVPSLRVSGLTTTSLAAMREYLVGEQHYRRSEWDSAAAAFTRAIEQDSTFALAHYRLASSVGWSGGLTAVDALKAGDAALRFSNRLPPREQTLVRAYNLFQHQRLAATDSARAYVRKYPDDVDGWFLLGETQYHTRQLVGYDAATLRAPFDSVLARDSTLTPASIHPIEIAIQSRDKPAYERYLRVLESSGNAQENLAYRGAGEMVFGTAPADSATAGAMVRYGGSLGGVLGALYTGGVTGDSVLARYERWGEISPFMPTRGQVQYLIGKGVTLATMGRFQEAQRISDSLMKVAPNEAQGILMAPRLLGFAPAAYQPPELKGFDQAPRRNPFQVYFTVIFALNRGDRAEAARLSDSLLAHQAPNMPPQIWAMLRAAKGWAAMMAGDTTAGVAAMRTALEDVGAGGNSFLTAPLRLQLAAALTQQPATHDEGRRMLRYSFTTDIGAPPLALYALGRAEEAAGNRPAAAEAYGQFLRLWDKADPMLQPQIAEVKEALTRVTGEGK
ncbi:MAG: serine/threonine-protein kinase [Gemmatimonadales bacterium]